MNSDSVKAKAFIARLLQNPALKGFSALQQEEQIIQFLHANAAQLAPTLSSGQFFPGKNWSQIFSLLVGALYGTINDVLTPDLEKIVSRLNFTFIQLMQQTRLEQEKAAAQVGAYLTKLKDKPETRRELTGPFTAAHFGITNRYLEEIFLRKSYIHFELTKVQRLRLGVEEVRHFLDLNLLLKPAVYLFISGSQGQDRATGMVQNQFAERALSQLGKELKALPEPVLKSVVHGSVSFNDNRFIEATARLSAIFSARGRNYQANVKVDRGADTPDKSWFSTARRNYRFYGFDIKMLDELYKIAAENMW
ncbi:MAG: hypothetical protein EA427_12560 [Spirochaetaceae bacterium]|nr:MAG: hypothetical protein EA427_12560 [Spirochaetaceae bacterium]